MMDPGLYATVSLNFAYVLANFQTRYILINVQSELLLVAILYTEATEAICRGAFYRLIPPRY
jgi:hypothetical protein